MGNTALALTELAGDPASPVHRLDPRAKIIGLITVTVTAVATPPERWPVWVGCTAVLLVIAAVARVGPGALWRRGRVVVPVLMLAALLPLVRENGLVVMAALMAKATIGTLSAVLLLATTGFPDLLRGLEALRVPRMFVLIAALMYRYLFVIAAEAVRMRWALAARGYHPRNALQAGPVGRAAGALFLRSYGRGERVHRAMLARGFSGRMPQLQPLALSRADVGFATTCLAGAAAGLFA